MFIAQLRGIHLTFGHIVAVRYSSQSPVFNYSEAIICSFCNLSVTATAASIGAAGIPQAGLITMVRNMQLIWFIVISKNILISFQGHGT